MASLQTPIARETRPPGIVTDVTDIEIVVAKDVPGHVAERGGKLYVWVSLHGWCCGRLALLEAETGRPTDQGLQFRRVRVPGFELYLDAARRVWPEKLSLELGRRGRKVRAFWNDQAWVG
jgi:hypothetical protein